MREASRVFISTNPHVMAKYNDIVKSLTYNHIRIWGREDMVMAIDLTYHSVRRFVFQRNTIRGWMNTLIIGDSGQGKTVATEALMKHFNLGYKASAESATRAGLLWGVDIKGNMPNTLIWGSIPRNTGRLVVIDELKEIIKTGAFAQLTEARSSGVVNVDTIESGRAMAETRLILLTNPPAKKRMGSYMYPVESVPDLIPDLEDTRRFDLVVGVASKEISDRVIHQDIETMASVADTYNSDTCKNHLLWIWNLTPDDIVIPHPVEVQILERSLEMCSDYSSIIPIVEPADHREKLARVAVALAARLDSTDKDNRLLVTGHHVEAAHVLMDRLYYSKAWSSAGCAYR